MHVGLEYIFLSKMYLFIFTLNDFGYILTLQLKLTQIGNC